MFVDTIVKCRQCTWAHEYVIIIYNSIQVMHALHILNNILTVIFSSLCVHLLVCGIKNRIYLVDTMM